MRFIRQSGDGAPDRPWAVVVAADRPTTRAALRGLVDREPDFHVVGEATTAEGALDVIAAADPDVLVLDWTMPGLHGVQALRHLRAALPDLRIISVSLNDARIYETPALAAGASAYVSTEHAEQLVGRIREMLVLPV